MTISVETQASALKRSTARSDAGPSTSPDISSFPDRWYADGILKKLPVLLLPLLYLGSMLLYSAEMTPWGQHVDPESAYAMNGLIP